MSFSGKSWIYETFIALHVNYTALFGRSTKLSKQMVITTLKKGIFVSGQLLPKKMAI